MNTEDTLEKLFWLAYGHSLNPSKKKKTATMPKLHMHLPNFNKYKWARGILTIKTSLRFYIFQNKFQCGVLYVSVSYKTLL